MCVFQIMWPWGRATRENGKKSGAGPLPGCRSAFAQCDGNDFFVKLQNATQARRAAKRALTQRARRKRASTAVPGGGAEAAAAAAGEGGARSGRGGAPLITEKKALRSGTWY